jgi:hypothetical protein
LFTLVNTRSKTHWVAVEVDFDEQKVTVMDSMCPDKNSTERTEIRKISTNIKKWAAKKADARKGATGTDTTTLYGPVESWQAKLCITCPQQRMTCDGKSYENVWDCGLFALAAVASRFRRLEYHNTVDILRQRACLAAWIISNDN